MIKVKAIMITASLLSSNVTAVSITELEKEIMFAIMTPPTLAYTCDADVNSSPPVYMRRLIKQALGLSSDELDEVMESPTIISEYMEYIKIYSTNGQSMSKKYCDLARAQAQRLKELDK